MLTFQFQPAQQAVGAAASSTQRNHTKAIFEELVFTLSIAQLQNERAYLKQVLAARPDQA